MSKDKNKEKPVAEPEVKTEPVKAEINPLEIENEALKQELAETKDKYLRMLAETDNIRKRNNDEVKREKKYSSQDVCDKLIDGIDIFDAALKTPTEDPAFKNFLFGFKMIKDMLFQVLQDEGVTPIALKIGDPFDAITMHAVDTLHDPEQPENTVLKIIKQGYLYKDRLLRPAMVTTNVIPKPEIINIETSNPSDKVA